ncbi:hypothetical protein MLD38_002356 [Melastoma candidum]|uniref:Uncharacterized protein n=1 Tax=Melastoma candidum TaxID=119954 RepID=A0ACB9S3G4_9MYRT|nr:hypothetical protein MLD38_002356 [Melastoma candidum]
MSGGREEEERRRKRRRKRRGVKRTKERKKYFGTTWKGEGVGEDEEAFTIFSFFLLLHGIRSGRKAVSPSPSPSPSLTYWGSSFLHRKQRPNFVFQVHLSFSE